MLMDYLPVGRHRIRSDRGAPRRQINLGVKCKGPWPRPPDPGTPAADLPVADTCVLHHVLIYTTHWEIPE
jgi:hypothetical protein